MQWIKSDPPKKPMKDKPLTSICNRPLRLFLVATFLSIMSGCSSVERVDAPRTQMTVLQAGQMLRESLSHLWSRNNVREVKFNRHRVTFRYELPNDEFYGSSAGQTRDQSVSFAEVNNLSVDGIDVLSNGHFMLRFDTKYAALKFVDALLTLQEAGLAPDPEEADFTAFTIEAKAWLVVTPKPEMSDEARTYKLSAEDAFKRKDFAAALKAYCDALIKFPMWPEGHYNAAVLAAEAEDFELAAQHMRRYLVLAPDAKDAAAAKDKLLLWQHKAKP